MIIKLIITRTPAENVLEKHLMETSKFACHSHKLANEGCNLG